MNKKCADALQLIKYALDFARANNNLEAQPCHTSFELGWCACANEVLRIIDDNDVPCFRGEVLSLSVDDGV